MPEAELKQLELVAGAHDVPPRQVPEPVCCVQLVVEAAEQMDQRPAFRLHTPHAANRRLGSDLHQRQKVVEVVFDAHRRKAHPKLVALKAPHAKVVEVCRRRRMHKLLAEPQVHLAALAVQRVALQHARKRRVQRVVNYLQAAHVRELAAAAEKQEHVFGLEVEHPVLRLQQEQLHAEDNLREVHAADLEVAQLLDARLW